MESSSEVLESLMSPAGKSMLRAACQTGHRTLNYMLTPLPEPGRQKLLGLTDVWGWTSLHWAAHLDHLGTIKSITSSLSPANVYELLRIQNGEGNTALHIAAKKGHTEIFNIITNIIPTESFYRLLLVQNGVGNTAVHLAVLTDDDDAELLEAITTSLPTDLIYRILISTNMYGNSAIHYAASRCNIVKIECLLAHLIPEQCLEILDIQNCSKQTAEISARIHGEKLGEACLSEFRRISTEALENRMESCRGQTSKGSVGSRQNWGLDSTDLSSTRNRISDLENTIEDLKTDRDNLYHVCTKLSNHLNVYHGKVAHQEQIIKAQQHSLDSTQHQLGLSQHTPQTSAIGQLRQEDSLCSTEDHSHRMMPVSHEFSSTSSSLTMTPPGTPVRVCQLNVAGVTLCGDSCETASIQDNLSSYTLDIHSLDNHSL